MKKQNKPIEKKYHSKDLNIAYNDGIEQGAMREQNRIIEKLEKILAEQELFIEDKLTKYLKIIIRELIKEIKQGENTK